MASLKDLAKRLFDKTTLDERAVNFVRQAPQQAVNNFNPFIGQALNQVPKVQTQIGTRLQQIPNISSNAPKFIPTPLGRVNQQIYKPVVNSVLEGNRSLGRSMVRMGQGQFANRGNRIEDFGNLTAVIPMAAVGGQATKVGLANLARQEGKFGNVLRTISPTLKGLDRQTFHEITIMDQATGKAVKRLPYKSLNDATAALRGLTVEPGQIALPPREVIRQADPVFGLGMSDVSKGRRSAQAGIPTYSEAQDLIAKSGGYFHIHNAPLAAKNKYAADELATSLKLNPKYLYENATKKGIDLTEELARLDANPELRRSMGPELINKVSVPQAGLSDVSGTMGNMKWYRGVDQVNVDPKSGDKFFSASKDVAGDFGKVQKANTNDLPQNPLEISSKEELANIIGYKGDPLAEPRNLLPEQRFDALAKKYAQSKGHDGIVYYEGQLGEPELHSFGRVAQPIRSAQDSLRSQPAGLYDTTRQMDELLNRKIKVQQEIRKWEAKPDLTPKGTFDKTKTNKLFNLKNDLANIEAERARISRVAQQPIDDIPELMSTNDIRAIPNNAWTPQNIAYAEQLKKGKAFINGEQPISDAKTQVQVLSAAENQAPQVVAQTAQTPKRVPIRAQKTNKQPTPPDTTFSSDGIIPPQSVRIKTSANRAQEYAQDSWLRQRNLQNEKGVVVKDGANPYQAQELMSGRMSTRIEEVRSEVGNIDKEVLNISKNLGLKDKKLYKQVNKYLQAVHAPERNAALGDGAAGISTKEAQKIVSEINGSPIGKEIQKVASMMQELNKKTLDILLDGGIIDKEMHTLLRTKYKNHVPLQRVMTESDDIVEALTGRGLNVKGTGLQRAKGSDKEVEDIFGNIVANVDQAIMRAEKNRVNLNTLNFARNNKALGIFEEVKPTAIGQTFGKDGKPILEKITDPQVLHIRENGKSVYLKIKDPKLAVVLQDLGKEELPALLKYVGTFTRTYSALHTRFNPEFALSNIIRDLQEMAVFSASQKGIGFGGAGKTVVKTPKSAKAVMDFIRGVDSEGARLYKQMRLDGGTTGGMSLSTKEAVQLDIQKIQQLNRSNPRKAAEKTLQLVDKWNTVFEDSTRLSVYREALERGLSREQAASLAKNATVNFNKKGTGGSLINSLYMFSNASIQGSTKMIRAMRNPKVAGTVIAGVGSAVYATNKWNDSVDPEWRNKVTEWDRTSNLVIMLPSDEGAKYVTVPISWGLKPVLVSANTTYDIATGKENNLIDAGKAIVESAVNSYNPVGGTDLVSTAVPTVLDTPVDIARNKSWSGGLIKPYWMNNKPASEQYFKDTPNSLSGKIAVGAAAGLSNATGGLIEISPENIQYAYEQYVGGVGKSATRFVNTAVSLSQGEKPQAKNVPFVNRFYKTKTEEQTSKAVNLAKKEEIKQTGGSVQIDNELVYYDANGNEKTFDLSPDTSGTGIGALANSDWTAKQAAKLHRLEGIDQATKNEIYKKWGYTPEEARYADLASYNSDVSAQYLAQKSQSHEELINNILTGRVVSITGQQFADNGTITKLNEQGLLSDAEARMLKKIKIDKNGKDLSKGTGSKKGKKLSIKSAPAPKSIKLAKSSAPKLTKFKNPKKPTLKNVTATKPKQYKVKGFRNSLTASSKVLY